MFPAINEHEQHERAALVRISFNVPCYVAQTTHMRADISFVMQVIYMRTDISRIYYDIHIYIRKEDFSLHLCWWGRIH